MARTLKEYPTVVLKPPAAPVSSIEDRNGGKTAGDGKIDFVRVFGRPGPVHIEIGTGKAAFLLNEARTHPEVNFLGIERASKYYRYAVDRIGRWGLTNVRIIRTDAAALLANSIPENSVDCFHIYFPDPWPKRRHNKRRFFCPANLQHLLRTLKTGGQLKIATDHADYFQQIRNIVGVTTLVTPTPFEEIEFLPAAGADKGELLGTNFERKYRKENRPIYTLAIRKK